MDHKLPTWYHVCEWQKNQAYYWFFAGHAIGFFHEQSRPDRDQFVIVQLQNVIPGEAWCDFVDLIQSW